MATPARLFGKANPPASMHVPKDVGPDPLVRVWALYERTLSAVLVGPPERPQLRFWLWLASIDCSPAREGIVTLRIPRDFAEEREVP